MKTSDQKLTEWATSEWKDEMTEKPRVDREGRPYMWKEMNAHDRCFALLAQHGEADAMGSLADWYVKASRDAKLSRKYKFALEEAEKWARLAAAKGNPAAVGFFGSQEPWLKRPANKRKYARHPAISTAPCAFVIGGRGGSPPRTSLENRRRPCRRPLLRVLRVLRVISTKPSKPSKPPNPPKLSQCLPW